MSHVGSFPETSKSTIDIFRDMVGVGVDVPPYPQVRSFIEIYLKPLVSLGFLEVRGREYFLRIGEFEEARLEAVVPPEAIECAREKSRLGIENLRAPITGPLTLASNIYLGGVGFQHSLISEKELVFEFLGEYVALNALKLRDLGYTYIFLDEPVLSNIVGSKHILFKYSEEELVELYSSIMRRVDGVTFGIHVCGRIPSRLFKLLARIEELKILNHEFRDTRENMDSIDPETLELYDKFLAPGVVSSKNPSVEDVESTVLLLENLASRYKIERLDLISGDCGFSGLKGVGGAYDIAIRKLEVIRKAVDQVLSGYEEV